MVYLLAVVAIAMPVLLVVQTIRGRVKLQCCSADAAGDARMRPSTEDSAQPTA